MPSVGKIALQLIFTNLSSLDYCSHLRMCQYCSRHFLKHNLNVIKLILFRCMFYEFWETYAMCNLHYNEVRIFPLFHKVFSCLFVANLPPLIHQPLEASDLITDLIILPFREHHINRITQYVSLPAWLMSPSKILLHFIHIVSYHSFLLSSIPLWMHHDIFVHSPHYGHLGGVQLLVPVNESALNICAQGFSVFMYEEMGVGFPWVRNCWVIWWVYF